MIIELIAKETGVSAHDLSLIVETASHRYRTYNIPKRTGGGTREINHPAPAVKFLQRWIVRNFIGYLPVHPSVTSYRKSIGIIKNAKMHAAHNYLLKMDLQNFFPSIKGEDIRNLIIKNIEKVPFKGLDAVDIDTIIKISCRNNRLTIGAPSSPAISNAVLYGFDEFISHQSSLKDVVYSRYADDLSFSTDRPNVLSEILTIVKSTLAGQQSPLLNVNFDKTIFASKKRRRVVTGLVLTSDKKVSIGRDKKREIKTLCYRFSKAQLSPEAISKLRGYLSFVKSVEPSFITSLNKKYGMETMIRIMSAPLIKTK